MSEETTTHGLEVNTRALLFVKTVLLYRFGVSEQDFHILLGKYSQIRALSPISNVRISFRMYNYFRDNTIEVSFTDKDINIGGWYCPLALAKDFVSNDPLGVADLIDLIPKADIFSSYRLTKFITVFKYLDDRNSSLDRTFTIESYIGENLYIRDSTLHRGLLVGYTGTIQVRGSASSAFSLKSSVIPYWMDVVRLNFGLITKDGVG